MSLWCEQGNYVSFGEWVDVDLMEFDVVWLWQDLFFDMGYIINIYLLDWVYFQIFVVNDLFWVCNCFEKLLVLDFFDLMLLMLIFCDMVQIWVFWQWYGDIIVKLFYGNGGVGVFYLWFEDLNLFLLIEIFIVISCELIIVQKYLFVVVKGDKCIILVDGQLVGVINCVFVVGEVWFNMYVGGCFEQVGLIECEYEICWIIGFVLCEKGLIFIGIDVIDGWLIEINVILLIGIQELEWFDGINVVVLIWEVIEWWILEGG